MTSRRNILQGGLAASVAAAAGSELQSGRPYPPPSSYPNPPGRWISSPGDPSQPSDGPPLNPLQQLARDTADHAQRELDAAYHHIEQLRSLSASAKRAYLSIKRAKVFTLRQDFQRLMGYIS